MRNEEEALKVAELRPDAIGLILEGIGTNLISKEKAQQIVQAVNRLNMRISTFLLTNATDPQTNIEYASFVGSTHIQLKGMISPQNVEVIKREMPQLRIVKVIHVTGPEAIEVAKSYEDTGVLDALLLDSSLGNMTGGTGKVHNWAVSRSIVEASSVPIWLAGGLNPTNLRTSIRIAIRQGFHRTGKALTRLLIPILFVVAG